MTRYRYSEAVQSGERSRTGVLVVRAWTDPGDTILKIRVTRVPNVESDEPAVMTSSSIDEVCEMVRAFLETFRKR